jgi:hypothetical protein
MFDLLVIILGILAWVVPYAIPREEDVDEDLAWVEREIAKAEAGPKLAPPTPEIMSARNERLERLRKLRAKLVRDNAA